MSRLNPKKAGIEFVESVRRVGRYDNADI